MYSRMRMAIAGIALDPAPDGVREDADRHREQRCDLELARFQSERHARGALGPLAGANCGLRLGQQRTACVGQADAAREPLEERPAEVRFEHPDLLRERRLGDAEASRAARERAFLDHGQKRGKPPQVHRQSL